MSFDGNTAEHIPHLRIGAERECGIISLEQIAYFRKDKHLEQSLLSAAAELTPEFPNITILDLKFAACQSTDVVLKTLWILIFRLLSEGNEHSCRNWKGHEQVRVRYVSEIASYAINTPTLFQAARLRRADPGGSLREILNRH